MQSEHFTVSEAANQLWFMGLRGLRGLEGLKGDDRIVASPPFRPHTANRKKGRIETKPNVRRFLVANGAPLRKQDTKRSPTNRAIGYSRGARSVSPSVLKGRHSKAQGNALVVLHISGQNPKPRSGSIIEATGCRRRRRRLPVVCRCSIGITRRGSIRILYETLPGFVVPGDRYHG
jgi:hypothetical protein